MKIFGDKKLTSLTTKIDSLISSFAKNPIIDNNSNDYSGKFIDLFTKKSKDSEFDKLLGDVTVPQGRLLRYSVYEEMNKLVPIVRNVINVYVSNTLDKNRVDSTGIIFSETKKQTSDSENEKVKASKEFIKDMWDTYDIFDKLKRFIEPRKYLYGDSFVEIVDVSEVDVPIKIDNYDGVISESNVDILEHDVSRIHSKSSLDQVIIKFADMLVEVDNNASTSKNIIIKTHKPHNIVILQTKYETTLGYLEVYSNEYTKNENINQRLSNVFGKVFNNKVDSNQNDIVNKLVYYILRKIISSNKTEDNQNIDSVLKNLDKSVYDFIKRVFIEQGLDRHKDNKLSPTKVRFIPPNRMVHFVTTSTSEYSPYGESVIENLILPCKLYLITQLSNIITKLARAPLHRVWKVDVGSTQMHAQLIQKLKQELYNTKITLDDFKTFKSISNILSDHKDMFIMTKGGQTPVDVEIKSLGDTSINTISEMINHFTFSAV